MDRTSTVDVTPRNDDEQLKRIEARHAPFRIEHVDVPAGSTFDYSWNGDSAYLAVHDMVLTDGELNLVDGQLLRPRDLRRQLAFSPHGANSNGWSAMSDRPHSFTALYFDQKWLLEQLEHDNKASLRPWVYFQHEPLLGALQKLSRVVRTGESSKLMLNAATLMSGAELIAALTGRRDERRGGLSDQQLKRAYDFIESHLATDICLEEIASAAGLSPYHFSRAFKSSTGDTPYQFVLNARIERAKALLREGKTAISAIAEQVGFNSSSQFSRRFTQVTGVAPRVFRSSGD